MSVDLHYNSFDGVLIIVHIVLALGGESIVDPLASLGEDVSVPEMMSHNYRF